MSTGLRDRKRDQLRATIERTAIDLMLERGYDAVTVETICAECEVSRRTFFNYFGSKELAVLGPGPDPIAPDAEEAFVRGVRGSMLHDLVRMLFTTMAGRPRDVDPTLWRDRLALIRGNAELAKALADRIAAKNADVHAVVERRIRARYEEGGVGSDQDPVVARQVSRQAGFIVAIWWGIARYAMQLVLENPAVSDEELTGILLDNLTIFQEADL